MRSGLTENLINTEVPCNLIIIIILLILPLCSVYLQELIVFTASLLSNKKWLDFVASFSLHCFSRRVPSYPQVPGFLLHLCCPPPLFFRQQSSCSCSQGFHTAIRAHRKKIHRKLFPTKTLS